MYVNFLKQISCSAHTSHLNTWLQLDGNIFLKKKKHKKGKMEGFCEEIGKLNHLLEILIEIFKKMSFNGNHILKLKETKSSFTV